MGYSPWGHKGLDTIEQLHIIIKKAGRRADESVLGASGIAEDLEIEVERRKAVPVRMYPEFDGWVDGLMI